MPNQQETPEVLREPKEEKKTTEDVVGDATKDRKEEKESQKMYIRETSKDPESMKKQYPLQGEPEN